MVDTAAHPPWTALRRWRRRAGWALLALGLLWLVSWLAVPPLLKWQIETRAAAALGRGVTVERVRFKPWSLWLRVEGLRVATADGREDQFNLGALEIDAELQWLLRRAPVVDALVLEAPRLRLRHLGAGRLDVDDVLARLRTPPDTPPDDQAGPARFALFNIRLSGGAVTLVDEPVGATHVLDALEMAVPFLSNIGSRREVQTEPHLAFRLNGSPFESSATTTPFADDRRTRAHIALPALDLAPYLPYWPAAWPVRPTAGTLHADLQVDFEQHGTPAVTVSGRLAVSGLRVDEPVAGGGARPLLAWERLELDLQRVEPLQHRAHLSALRWQQPRLVLHREAGGALALQRIARAFAPTGVPAAQAGEPVASAPWSLRLDRVDWKDAALSWVDAAVQPPAHLALDAVNLEAGPLTWPMTEAVPFEVSASLQGTPVRLRGTASDRQAQIAFEHDALPLALASPYIAQVLRPALAGELRSRGELRWQAAAPGAAGLLAVQGAALELTGVRLGPQRQPLAQLGRLAIDDAAVDLTARRVRVGGLRLEQPRLDLDRDAQGRLQVQDWWVAGPATTSAAGAAPPWDVTLADVRLLGGRLRWRDALPARPVDLRIDALDLRLQDLRPLAAPQPLMPLTLSARMAATAQDRADPGRLTLDGQLRLPLAGSDLALRGQVRAERLPLHGLEPYVADRLAMELLRADASYRGALALGLSDAGLSLSLAGDAALEDVQAHTLAPAEPLLDWKSLQVRGIALEQAPGQPLRLSVRETVLSDYFARVVIAPDGRINLQGLLKPADGAAPADAPPTRAASTSAAPRSDIRIGPVSLLNGRVLFSDRFIQPNYTANLSELSGTLSAFDSTPAAAGQAPTLADLSLKGRAEGTASLDISGRLNPLATPLALDIKGVVRDLELPPLSPYTLKYAGHGIERGKLSVDVAYRIAPDGQLTASNQIVLNQLDFGERVAGSTAPNLPLKLAVALLADRDGVIDINLPISGSINDPQFRLAPIIVKLVLNLIGKAITAPFALIANAFGGAGTDASQIAFEPGRAELSAAGRAQLDAVAKALLNRPALQLTVVGHSDLDAERAGLQRARLDAWLLAEKRRALARSGAPVPADLVVTADEMPALLREVYRRADIPKPRNLIGIAKDIPPAEMEALLLAAQPVTADAVRELAVARAVAVKDHLASRQLPESRLFLGAPRTSASGADWKPQAELRLAPR